MIKGIENCWLCHKWILDSTHLSSWVINVFSNCVGYFFLYSLLIVKAIALKLLDFSISNHVILISILETQSWGIDIIYIIFDKCKPIYITCGVFTALVMPKTLGCYMFLSFFLKVWCTLVYFYRKAGFEMKKLKISLTRPNWLKWLSTVRTQ